MIAIIFNLNTEKICQTYLEKYGESNISTRELLETFALVLMNRHLLIELTGEAWRKVCSLPYLESRYIEELALLLNDEFSNGIRSDLRMMLSRTITVSNIRWRSRKTFEVYCD